jgi:Polyketide cyclase / dehydrase and lipid transport
MEPREEAAVFQMSETVSIDRPPADVFSFVADLRNFPIWRANLASSRVVSDSPTDVGATCDEEIQVGPRKIPATCRITSFSAGREFLFQAISQGLVYDGHLLVEPHGSGCRLTLSGEVRLSGFMRLMQPVLSRRMRQGVRTEVAAIRDHMAVV